MKEWLKKILSPSDEASSKRLILVVLVSTFIISLFLIMYIKVEIANKELVSEMLKSLFWLILVFGGYVAGEPLVEGVKRMWGRRGTAEIIQAQSDAQKASEIDESKPQGG